MKTERNKRIDVLRRSQPIEELERKARKSARHKQRIWTIEEIDYAKAYTARMILVLGWD